MSARELLTERAFLTAAGTETYLLFQQGFELREFAAFEVFRDDEALAALATNYLTPILDTARQHSSDYCSMPWCGGRSLISSTSWAIRQISYRR